MSAQSERFIRRTLRRVARQRVAMVLQPGDVWVIELVAPGDEETVAALRTCHLRGWVEVLENAVPRTAVEESGEIGAPAGRAPVYQLTEAGWHVINRTHAWTVAIFVVTLATLIAAVVGAYLTARSG